MSKEFDWGEAPKYTPEAQKKLDELKELFLKAEVDGSIQRFYDEVSRQAAEVREKERER